VPTSEAVVESNRALYRRIARDFSTQRAAQRFLERELGAYFRHLASRGPLRVLDVGTGSGFALDVAERFLVDAELVGCDVSTDMLDLARRRHPRRELVLLSDARLPFEDRRFDVVLFVSSLHHVFDPFVLLRDAARVLDDGGEIYVAQEPNPVVNRFVNRIRRGLNLLPDETTRLAEYHQFETNGLDPARVAEALRASRFQVDLTFTNSSLVDEIESRLGAVGALPFRPLLALRSQRSCLSYALRAVRS
jgi:ubiquinone/menaquinone biosynthesis C-methylase UbiE